MTYLASDRFLIPAGDKEALRYFTRCLYVSHRKADRLLRATGRPQVRTASDEVLSEVEAILDALPPEMPRRRIVLRDYETSERSRVVAFLFDRGRPAPAMIAKAQPLTSSESLRRESDALRHLHTILPPPLRRTIPEVLHFSRGEATEVLVTSAVPGCSAYVDMQGSLAPSRYVERHFDAAARWLAAFHDATRLIDGGREHAAASHGDYWARNLLLSGDGSVGVVDWEDFQADASRWIDLFYFPLTYGLSYPWQRYRRLPPEEAFSKTFLEPNRVSRTVRRYLLTYASLTRLPQESMREAFGEFLATSGSMRGVNRTGDRQPVPWRRLTAQYQHAPESVFSG